MPAPSDCHAPVVHDVRAASAQVADAATEGVGVALGILSLGLQALRTFGESPATMSRQPSAQTPVSDVVDVVLAAAWGTARLSGRLAAKGAKIMAPALELALHPPLVPRRLQPGATVQLLTERWRRDRPETLRALGRWSATAVPGAVDATLAQVDVERVATAVLDHVDLDALVADIVRRLDVEAITVAVLRRMDLTRIASTAIERTDLDQVLDAALRRMELDAVLTSALSRVDLDRAVATVLERLDVDEVAAELLNQLDLTRLVLDRVDLGAVVAGALERVDLTAIVVDQVDLGSVVSAAVQQVDLTQIVLQRVDLGSVVSAALDRVDLTQIVLQQVDLIGVAEYVVEGIDLPEIIRESTGSVASEAVRGLRLQGVDADLAVGRVVDRMLRRHRRLRSEKVQAPLSSPDAPAHPPAGKPE